MFGHDDLGEAPASLPAPEAEPWDADKTIDYLESVHARVNISTGAPQVRFPDTVPASVIAEVMPHVRANRGYIIDHYFGEGTQADRDRARAERKRKRDCGILTGQAAEAERKRLIKFAEDRAALVPGAKVLFMNRKHQAVTQSEKPASKIVNNPWRRKIVVPIDREATHVSVTFDLMPWTPLPPVLTREEELVFVPIKASKKKTKDFNEH